MMREVGRGCLLGVALVVGLILLVVVFFVNQNFGLPEEWEIPDGHRGWVAVTVGDPNCPPLSRRGLTRVIEVDESGRGCTSDRPDSRFRDVTYVYVMADGRRTPLRYADRAYPGVQVWRTGLMQTSDYPYQIIHVYVGTEEEAEHANSRDIPR